MKYSSEIEIIKAINQRYKERLALNISAVREEDPELLAATYGREPFLGWRQALNRAGIVYENIVTRYQEEVECLICGDYLGNLAAHLIKIHGTTPEEYREEFPGADIVSETVRFMRGGILAQHPDRIPDWEPAMSIEYCLDKVYQYYKNGFYINRHTVNLIDSSIASKITSDFGPWDDVLKALGIEPRSHRRNVRRDDYTLAELNQWLKDREEAGLKNTREAVTGLAEEDGDQLRLRIVAWAFAYNNQSWQAVLDGSGRDLSHPSYNSRNFPDAQSVIDAIREMAAAGRTTSLSDVMLRIEDSYVAFASPRYFGSWYKALEAAGVEVTLKERNYEKKSEVVRDLKERIKLGFPLDVRSVFNGTRGDVRLFKASFRYFASWRTAVKEVSGNQAKLVAEAAKDNPFPTKKKVIEALQALDKAGELAAERRLPSNLRNQFLITMAHGFFGGWREANLAAGIDPKSYHDKNRNPTAFYATREEIIEGILYRHEEQLPMNARSVATGEDMDAPLIYSARKMFGSWEEGVEAAGLDYSQFVRKNQDYSIQTEYNKYESKEDVIEGIKSREASGKKLNARALLQGPREDRDSPLLRVGKELFGSWENALEAAGLNVDDVVKKKINPNVTKGMVYHTYETKEEVIAAIKKRKREKKALNTAALQSSKFKDRDFPLWKAGNALFGSWNNALEAAGIDLLSIYTEWQLKRMETMRKKFEKRK